MNDFNVEPVTDVPGQQAHTTSQAPYDVPRVGEYMPGDIPQPNPTADRPHAAAGETAPDSQTTKRDREPRKRTSLGTNTKRASGVRQLTEKDIKALHSLYGSLALSLSLIHPKGAQAIAQQSESCVDAWVELSKQNDSVRRAILAALEGSAWSAVISAHLPITLAFVPATTLERMPMLFGGSFDGAQVFGEESDE